MCDRVLIESVLERVHWKVKRVCVRVRECARILKSECVLESVL